MLNKNSIYMVAQYINFNRESLQKAIADWIFLLRILATPTTFQINQDTPCDFDADEVLARIANVEMTDDFWWRVTSEAGTFQVRVCQGELFCRNLFTESTFFQNETMLFDYFNPRMEKHGLYGYLRCYEEYVHNNASHMEERLRFESVEEFEALPKMYNREHHLVVDCNQFAGYDVFFRGLCLTSCWKMYFGKYYFHSIPKQIFDEVQEVESVQTLDNQLTVVTLYKDPRNWKIPVNQKYQFLFRAQMGFDQLAWDNGFGVLRDPYIEYVFEAPFVHTVQYFNEQGQATTKKVATEFITRSLNVSENLYNEQHIKGRLNAQAYFPYINESENEMMNFRIIYPELALDSGIAAYEYYIRDFLEADVITENRYKSFRSVLNFYLPNEDMTTCVPIDTLVKQLSDITFKKIQVKKPHLIYDLRKGEKKLRIVFSQNKQPLHKNIP